LNESFNVTLAAATTVVVVVVVVAVVNFQTFAVVHIFAVNPDDGTDSGPETSV
jgi:hypothetical protein